MRNAAVGAGRDIFILSHLGQQGIILVIAVAHDGQVTAGELYPVQLAVAQIHRAHDLAILVIPSGGQDTAG